MDSHFNNVIVAKGGLIQRPRLSRLLWCNGTYLPMTFLLFIFIVGVKELTTIIVARPDGRPYIPAFVLMLLLACLTLLYFWLDVRRLQRLFLKAEIVAGQITYIGRVSGSWYGVRVYYQFTYDNKRFEASISSWSSLPNLPVTSKVTVLVDPGNPNSSDILEKYL
jgi:Protein of unknown function (DUF3592)